HRFAQPSGRGSVAFEKIETRREPLDAMREDQEVYARGEGKAREQGLGAGQSRGEHHAKAFERRDGFAVHTLRAAAAAHDGGDLRQWRRGLHAASAKAVRSVE